MTYSLLPDRVPRTHGPAFLCLWRRSIKPTLHLSPGTSKTAVITAVLLFATSPLRAGEFRFLLDRYTGILFETAAGKESIRVYRRDDRTRETLFRLTLRATGAGTYATSRGLVFKLDHLSEPVGNDRRGHINSGDWELSLFGETGELRRFAARTPPVAFGREFPTPTYFGEKVP